MNGCSEAISPEEEKEKLQHLSGFNTIIHIYVYAACVSTQNQSCPLHSGTVCSPSPRQKNEYNRIVVECLLFFVYVSLIEIYLHTRHRKMRCKGRSIMIEANALEGSWLQATNGKLIAAKTKLRLLAYCAVAMPTLRAETNPRSPLTSGWRRSRRYPG